MIQFDWHLLAMDGIDVCMLWAFDRTLVVTLSNGVITGLRHPAQFVGYRGDALALTSVLLCHHGLHIEIVMNRAHPIGRHDPAGVSDVMTTPRRSSGVSFPG